MSKGYRSKNLSNPIIQLFLGFVKRTAGIWEDSYGIGENTPSENEKTALRSLVSTVFKLFVFCLPLGYFISRSSSATKGL